MFFLLLTLVKDKYFFRFVAVGLVGVIVDYSIYLGLTRGFSWWQENYLWANIIAIFLANLHNFLWHYHWTFDRSTMPWLKVYLKFLVISIIYLGLIQAGLWWLTTFYFWPDVLAKLFSNAVALIIYYLVVKKFIFLSHHNQKIITAS